MIQKRNLTLLLLLTLFSFNDTIAQNNGPVITIQGKKKNKAIKLNDLHVSVFVVENIAITTFEMSFYNPNDRVMEGELNFPLKNGASVSRFALDVNGVMREGVVVEKQKATQVFEAITRKNVDPGLAEMTKGNNFKARVYPIPAKGYKRVLVAFEHELKNKEESYLYQLPLNFKAKLKEFSVRAEVVLNQPEPVEETHETLNLNFQEQRNSFVSTYKKTNYLLDKQLTFSLKKPSKGNEASTYKGVMSDEQYFYINLPIKEEVRAKTKPKKIVVFWDVSSSAKDRDLNKEIAFLESYFLWLKNAEVELVLFSNEEHYNQGFQLRNGKQEELISKLKGLSYDGATNLGLLDFSRISCDEILFFSDGLSNFGEENTLESNTPVLAVNSAAISNHIVLEHLSASSNGEYLNTLELSAAELIKRATHQRKRFIRANYVEGELEELYPRPGVKLEGSFNCSGIIKKTSATVELEFGFGEEVTEWRKVSIATKNESTHPIGERIWAQKKLKALLVEDDANLIRAHGKEFNLVTPNTSLLVLDSVSDYVQYEINPPASMQKEYHELIKKQRRLRSEKKQDRIKRLCNSFDVDYTNWNDSIDYGLAIPIDALESAIVEYDAVVLEEAENSQQMNVRGQRSGSSVTIIDGVRMIGNNKVEFKTANMAKIELKKWESNTTYITQLKKSKENDLYSDYLKLKKKHGENPSFYFDVASYLFQKNQKKEALRVISNLAELELENTELLRTLGRKLSEFEFYKEALSVFKEVEVLRPFEPHSYLDLGLTYEELGNHQMAIQQLYTVIDKEWDDDIMLRFPGMELIVIHEINSIINRSERALNTIFIASCFLKNTPVDIRVVIDWDANETDIDLWITDPMGEKCSYNNRKTRIGGTMSNDITQGYGPEEFRLKKAVEGKYKIEAKFYGSRKQRLLSNVNIRAFVYTYFGTQNEEKQVLTIQLKPEKGGDYLVGEVSF